MKFTKSILKNGLRLITVPMKDNPTITVLVMVEAGSKYETKDRSGISHFLEHMFFKGTKRRPKAIDIARELDGIGSEWNAFTSQEFTGYYAKADYRHAEVLLDVVSDIYLHQTLPKPEIEKEKGVIIEEINMYQDLPQRHVQDLFMELLYGDQPAGWNIAGSKETVRAVTREALLEYKEKNYVSGATAVVVAGNFDEEKIAVSKAKRFGGMNKGQKHPKTKVIEKQTEPQVLVQYKKTDQAHLVLGVRTFDAYSSWNPTLRVLSTILGGGMSSRLFQKLREDMGVGYYVRSGNDSYTDHGFFEIATGVDHTRIDEVIRAVLSELVAVKRGLVPPEELKKAKDYVTGNMFLSLESSDSIADFYGYQEVVKRELKTPLEIAELIQKVSAEDIEKVADKIFRPECLNLAIVGPYRGNNRFKPLLLL